MPLKFRWVLDGNSTITLRLEHHEGTVEHDHGQGCHLKLVAEHDVREPAATLGLLEGSQEVKPAHRRRWKPAVRLPAKQDARRGAAEVLLVDGLLHLLRVVLHRELGLELVGLLGGVVVPHLGHLLIPHFVLLALALRLRPLLPTRAAAAVLCEALHEALDRLLLHRELHLRAGPHLLKQLRLRLSQLAHHAIRFCTAHRLPPLAPGRDPARSAPLRRASTVGEAAAAPLRGASAREAQEEATLVAVGR
mmetsp:Transcript_182321/g.443795  ORF Transcript_182321/g.443795 Transcript_182321/m.443795 type:complete len:249 (-) Transcript_182321:1-747(-)